MPEPLRTEIANLIEWETAELRPGGRGKRTVRPITAHHLQTFLSRFYGFVSNVKGHHISALNELCNEDLMYRYVVWCRTERETEKHSLVCRLAQLNGAVKAYPYFIGKDFDWLKRLIGELSNNEEDELLAREAKQERWVDYDRLETLPEKMRRDADGAYRKGTVQYARAMRDVLLATWLITLPWRQRNLRECRIGRREDGANIFKAGVSDSPTIARPRWLLEELARNPNLEVWQFRFRRLESKTGHFIHGVLPKQISVPMEEYLNTFRPLLLRDGDPRTVFVNDLGRPLTEVTFRRRIINVTYKYFGRLVDPHLFRDIFAVKFLEEHPENFLTLSKILWHRDVKTTIRLYGRNYDESHGARAAEEWRDERSGRKNR
jgi:hypothetical protein